VRGIFVRIKRSLAPVAMLKIVVLDLSEGGRKGGPMYWRNGLKA